jgi:hypothetical protein
MTRLPATWDPLPFSRRGSLSRGVGLIVVGLWPVAVANAASPCGVDEPHVTRVELPFQLHPVRAALMIQVEVDGRNRKFFVDTGATRTVVDVGAAGREAGLALQRAHFAERGVGVAGEGVVAEVDLNVGGRAWPKRRVVIMDLSELERVYGQKVDGIVGMDLLREFGQVVISFGARRLCFDD